MFYFCYNGLYIRVNDETIFGSRGIVLLAGQHADNRHREVFLYRIDNPFEDIPFYMDNI